MILLAACGAAPAPPLPEAATATDVVVLGEDWAARTPSLTVASAVASTEQVAVATTSGRPPLEIRAARSDWDLRTKRAKFEGDVVVVRAQVEMRCASLDVRYADGDRIERVFASGGVVVTREGRTATSKEAELDGATGRIVLTGDPQLSEGPNTLVGARIELWLDDERATCEGTAGAPCRLVVDGSALR